MLLRVVLPAVLLVLCVESLTVPKPSRRRRQARWSQAPIQSAGAFHQPQQRYALVAVDAMGRPLPVPSYPMNQFEPQRYPQRYPQQYPQRYPQRPPVQFLPPQPAPPVMVHRPRAPVRPVFVQAPARPQSPMVVVETKPPECGTIMHPGECCKEPIYCPEMFRLMEEEPLACAHKGLGAVCCKRRICD